MELEKQESIIIEDEKGFKKFWNKFKKFWDWVWNSNSLLSWIIAFIMIYIFIKFIFFPGLSLLTGTSLPLAGVESSSMDHQIAKDEFGRYSLCGKVYEKSKKKYMNFDDYWENCGEWYEKKNITKEKFRNFPLHNGFKKGDIVIVWGRFKPKIGDIVIFKPNPESTAPRPIVHRIIDINEKGIFQTKGDHNEEQLKIGNNIYNTDETNINENQIIGKVIFRIPFLGWFKIWALEIWKLLKFWFISLFFLQLLQKDDFYL